MHPNAIFSKNKKDAVLFGFEKKRTKDASFLKKDVHIIKYNILPSENL